MPCDLPPTQVHSAIRLGLIWPGELLSELDALPCVRQLNTRSTLACLSGGLTVEVEAGVGNGGGEAEAALLLAAEGDAGRLPVQADAKALQLVLDQLLVRYGLQAVQHDQDEVACPGCTDDLHTATKGEILSHRPRPMASPLPQERSTCSETGKLWPLVLVTVLQCIQ